MLRLGLAFAAGAVAGALALRWYIKTHPGAVVGGALADELGRDTPAGKLVRGLGTAVDEALVQ